jgi:hypothetical protein
VKLPRDNRGMIKLSSLAGLRPLSPALTLRFGRELTELELRRRIKVRDAAELNDMSEASFRRHYSHLITKMTERRDGVTLGDALTLPPPSED